MDRGTGTPNNTGYNWTFEEVTWLPIPMNTTAGWSTLYSPVALRNNYAGTQRVEAYVGEIKENSFNMTRVDEDGIIPANTPVVLKYLANYDEVKGAVYLEIVNSEKVYEGNNNLEGTYADTYIADDAYVLSYANVAAEGEPVQKKIGFFMASKNQQNNTAFLNNGFKAYLPANGSNARSLVFSFGDDTETAIESVEAENANVNTEVYDLAGRRVLNAKKGVFVVNGKVIVK